MMLMEHFAVNFLTTHLFRKKNIDSPDKQHIEISINTHISFVNPLKFSICITTYKQHITCFYNCHNNFISYFLYFFFYLSVMLISCYILAIFAKNKLASVKHNGGNIKFQNRPNN